MKLERIKRSIALVSGLLLALAAGCGAEEEQPVFISDEGEDMTPIPCVQIKVGDSFFSIYMEDNPSAEAFVDEINHGGLTVDMHDYGNFEKVGDLPRELPTGDEEITTVPGDLILYQGNKITVYYDENTWNFTKLGHINASEEEIKEVFGGEDDITAEFSVEWTE